jgi:hypothetical protein
MSNESINIVFFFSVLWFIVPPIIGSRIAYNRGRSRGGAFALCLVLGWLGLLIVGCWRKDWEEINLRQASYDMAKALSADIRVRTANDRERLESSPDFDSGWMPFKQTPMEPEPYISRVQPPPRRVPVPREREHTQGSLLGFTPKTGWRKRL